MLPSGTMGSLAQLQLLEVIKDKIDCIGNHTSLREKSEGMIEQQDPSLYKATLSRLGEAAILSNA